MDIVVDSSNKCLAVRTVGMPFRPGFHKNVSFAKRTNQIAERIFFGLHDYAWRDTRHLFLN